MNQTFWNDPTVVKLLEGMISRFRNRTGEFGVLHDALIEAGCKETDDIPSGVLEHCGIHIRTWGERYRDFCPLIIYYVESHRKEQLLETNI